jgi:coenzyme F420-dependent glucose-6-phosphate dehydrogenase
MPQTRQVKLGYKLTSEEFSADDLVGFARAAEEHGFSFASISDHFHPWTSGQGQSPFVWAVIGGIAQVTSKIKIGTGVTCPTFRIHPAIVAQAAATAAAMLPGRFFLGVGTGENLNEHILGEGDEFRLSEFDCPIPQIARKPRPTLDLFLPSF